MQPNPPLTQHSFCAERGPPLPPCMSGASTPTQSPHAFAPPGLGIHRSGDLRRAKGRGGYALERVTRKQESKGAKEVVNLKTESVYTKTCALNLEYGP